MKNHMKQSITVYLSIALGASGCIADQDKFDDELEVVDDGEENHVSEAVNQVRADTYWWGFTDCATKSESEFLISVFSYMAITTSGAAGYLPSPWSQLIGTAMGAGYWGWLAWEFAEANSTSGSKGVCTDWYWLPAVKDIYPWY